MRLSTAVLFVAGMSLWVEAHAGNPPVEHSLVRFEMPEVEARPGMPVEVPVLIDSSVPLSMVTFSVEYDAAALDLVGPVLSDEITAILADSPGAEWELTWYADEAEGWAQFALVVDYGGHLEFTIPAGEQFQVASIEFDVAADAPNGRSAVAFARPAEAQHKSRFEGKKGPVYNSARLHGPPFSPGNRFDEGDDPELEDGAVLIGVVGDLGIFLRGDANMDGNLDISDAVTLVNCLFLGADSLPCEDAGDANDDGSLDISDPVTILFYLFAEGGSAEHSPLILDEDKTLDSLGCAGY